MSALDSQHLLAQTFSLLADWLKAAKLSDGQTLWLAFQGEHSEFVRFNHARVRQVGQVQALDLSLSLVQAIKAETNVTQFAQVQSALRLTGDASQDLALCEQALHALQAVVKQAK